MSNGAFPSETRDWLILLSRHCSNCSRGIAARAGGGSETTRRETTRAAKSSRRAKLTEVDSPVSTLSPNPSLSASAGSAFRAGFQGLMATTPDCVPTYTCELALPALLEFLT
jgi:hypothetical protein